MRHGGVTIAKARKKGAPSNCGKLPGLPIFLPIEMKQTFSLSTIIATAVLVAGIAVAALSDNVVAADPKISGATPDAARKASPTLSSTPDPAAGTMLAQPLRNSATLQVGASPTGTISFALYPPSDPKCLGTPVGSGAPLVVNVNGNGAYRSPIVEKRFITQAGTYRWTASYSGDANNSPVTTQCANAPVKITQPVLSIAKTPDNATITAGGTATFTIVVTNLGPGTAKNGNLSDALPVGGGVTWTTKSVGCAVSGAPGTQMLDCSLGVDLMPGTNFTAVVSAVTTPTQCAVMDSKSVASATNAAQVSDPGKITCVLR